MKTGFNFGQQIGFVKNSLSNFFYSEIASAEMLKKTSAPYAGVEKKVTPRGLPMEYRDDRLNASMPLNLL